MLARLISPLSFNPQNFLIAISLPLKFASHDRDIKTARQNELKIYTARFTILTPLNNFYASATSLHIPNNTVLAQSNIIRYGSLSPLLFPKISLAECGFALQSKLKFTLRRSAAWLLNFISQ